MTTLLQLVACMTVLTWVSIMAAAFLRNREWTLEGIKFGLGNRDTLPEPTLLGGRAVRAAANTTENFVLFAALVAPAQGSTARAQCALPYGVSGPREIRLSWAHRFSGPIDSRLPPTQRDYS